jgi:tRNA 2-thiouridine synthesizing protein A
VPKYPPSPEALPEIVIDARGHRCPVPTLKLRRAMEAAPVGARLALIADDPLARIDVPHFLAAAGGELVETSEVNGAVRFLIVKSANKDVR